MFGQPVTFTASVASDDPEAVAPTGPVTFYDGATALGTGTLDGSGVATFTTAGLVAGAHSISAVYAGDVKFATSTTTTTAMTVDRSSTSAMLASSLPATAFGQSVTFTATIAAVAPGAGVPTGTASFYDGTSLLATVGLDNSGSAADTVSGLSVGSHAISAVYNGDANFATSTTATTEVVVNPATTGVTVVSSDLARTFGQSVTFTATVTPVAPGAGAPTGTLTFYSGATPIGTADLAGGPDAASITLSGLDAGPHSITAVYSGDPDFVTSTSAAIGEVISPAATTTRLTTSGLPTVYGQPETLVATVAVVAPGVGTPTGSVNFFAGTTSVGSAPLVDGVATLQTTSIPTAVPRR